MLSKGLSHSVITKSFLPIFYDEANVLAEILINKSDPESKECEISLPLNMATMDIIGRSSLGVHFNSQKGGHHPFVENFKQMLEVCFGFFVNYFWKHNDKMLLLMCYGLIHYGLLFY